MEYKNEELCAEVKKVKKTIDLSQVQEIKVVWGRPWDGVPITLSLKGGKLEHRVSPMYIRK
jgi:hypothetical protein